MYQTYLSVYVITCNTHNEGLKLHSCKDLIRIQIPSSQVHCHNTKCHNPNTLFIALKPSNDVSCVPSCASVQTA